MNGLKVLITNITLATRTGTEIYVRDLALGLLRRGHKPIVYSTDLGEIASELRAKTVPVVDDLAQVTATPDVIHGHHHPETLAALLRFPTVPGVLFCHDWTAWHDVPVVFPRILRHVAVDDTCFDRLVMEHGIPKEKVCVILNFVDLDRFRRRPPLPDQPKRALVFSNTASEQTHLAAVRAACTQANIALDVIGAGSGNSLARPEEALGNYDLVFAKGKSALEALAVGAAVILCDAAGAGPMVTTTELDRLRRLNFGMRTLQKRVLVEVLAREIARYDCRDAAEVSRRIREEAGLEAALDELTALYHRVVEEFEISGKIDREAEEAAVASYIRAWVSYGSLRQLQSRIHLLQVENDRIRAEQEQKESKIHQLQFENTRIQTENDHVRRLLEAVHNSATIRLRNRLVTLPLIGSLARKLARRMTGYQQLMQ